MTGVTDAAVDVLVVGDANPDLLLTGDTVPRFGQAEQLLDSAELLLGGSAAIVACGLARLGVSAQLDLELIARLAVAVPVPLVLHGSSGVADAIIADAVAAGIRKVNVGTALNIAFTASLREALAAQPDAVDPRKYTRDARAAMADLVARFCRVVDSRLPAS